MQRVYHKAYTQGTAVPGIWNSDNSPLLTQSCFLPVAAQSDLLWSSCHGAWQLYSSPPSGPVCGASSLPINKKDKRQMTKAQNLEQNGALKYLRFPSSFSFPSALQEKLIYHLLAAYH